MTHAVPCAEAPPPIRPSWLADLPVNYFAMVMATGIVSLACQLSGFDLLARALLELNIGFYIILWILLIVRLVRHPDRLLADLLSHGRCVGFFTIVAATCVLGSQLLVIAANPVIAAVLWVIGIVLWAGLTYTILTLLTVKRNKPSLPEGINGGWLLMVVAAQSVAVLGAQLAVPMGWTQTPVLFFSLTLWLGGGMLYIWIISLQFYRYAFFALSPSDMGPPYWINMGAVAISTLAGTMLAANVQHSAVVSDILPFIKGITLLFWATATWWIPMLVILGIWRHGFERFPLRYDPQYWGAVFPLGMYTVATYRLSQLLQVPFLEAVPRVFVYVALGAWCAVIAGLIWSLTVRAQTAAGGR